MAITLKQEPKGYAPVYNPIEWVIDSDKKTEDSFKYVADVFVSGVTTPAFFRLKTQAHPTLGFGVFDIHRILENFLTSNIDKSTFGFQRNDSSFVKYDIKFGEEFDAVPAQSSGTTVFPDLLVKTDNFVINAAQEFLDWKDFATSDFLIDDMGSQHRFLTNIPHFFPPDVDIVHKIRNGADAWLHFIWSLTNAVAKLQVTTFDVNDNQIQIVRITNNFTDINEFDQRFLRVGIGFNMNSVDPGDIEMGSLPVLTTSVRRYEIRLSNNINNGVIRTSEIFIDYECTKHDIFTIHFLNKLGGFDTFSFIRLSRRNSDISRIEYKKNTGTLNADGTKTYSSKDRGIVQLDTSIEDSVLVSSEWLTEAESTWLKELITSPEVFYDDGTELIAVNIRNSRYEEKKRANDVIFNYTLEFKFGQIHSRQRG